ncbi:MAG: DNA mismatch repair protein MutS [Mucilaginibacter sp.]|uniref:MutS-related protein n=1 Tax=Mucilaginibacter sp. TaxID=1882438 RepID=UPI0034E4CA5E
MTAQEQEILKTYTEEATALSAKILGYKRSINQVSFSRLIVFFAGITLIYILGSINVNYAFAIGGTMVMAFVRLIRKQSKLQKELAFDENLFKVLSNEIDHLKEAKNSYDNGFAFADGFHPYTDDLDIFGENSLFHYVNRCNTQSGKNILAGWFKKPAEKITIESRQQAITELRNYPLETLNFRAALIAFNGTELTALSSTLKEGLKEKLVFIHKNWLRNYVKSLPFLMAALIIGAVFNGIFLKLLGFFMLMNFFLSGIYTKQVNQVYGGFSRSSSQLSAFAAVLNWIEEKPWKSGYLQSLIASCASSNQQKAHQQIASLAKILSQFDYRLNMIVGTILNLLLMWDVRCAIKLAEWHQTAASNVTDSFEVIATFEALISLSTLHYNHPNWPFPKITTEFCLKTERLGHPLITEEKRVVNNFSMENHKTVDVITGSNMAGKSTFLRTLGINLVLAYSGAPVCAESMTTSVMKLVSYMRIKDSLNESTSTFKAELDRLKMILEKTAAETDVLVLIDEMLRGTNSKDKYAGSKAFIERLIRQQTAALVATHDLQIADLADEHSGAVRNFHFDIKMQNQDMFFDYKIKDGACKTFNASILLREIGLEVG